MEQLIAFQAPPSLDDGYGDGYGYGSGSGSGSGDGYGYGSGSGSGSGDGYGSGSGSGYGDKENNLAYWAAVAGSHVRDGAVLALWKSRKDGSPANGGSLPPVKVGDIHEVKGRDLALCGPGALHATWTPEDWKGDRMWIVALYGDIAIQGNKLGALKREIVAEVA